jgi:hypothetical protein
MAACCAKVSLEGMLRGAAPPPAKPVAAPAAGPVERSRWRIVAADGSRDACPCPTPKPADVERENAAEFARLATGLEVMAAAGLSLPERGKPKVAMPDGAPDMSELLAAASSVAPLPPEEPAVERAPHAGRGPSGTCPCPETELPLAPVVEAWPRLPHSIQSAILAVVSATLE